MGYDFISLFLKRTVNRDCNDVQIKFFNAFTIENLFSFYT